MNEIANRQFKHDFILQTIVKEVQFEQWLKFTFYLNQKLSEEYETIYQDSFYIKIYELLTEGLIYANKVHKYLLRGENHEKTNWYSKLITGLNKIKLDLNESEILYIEYRRHSASHIFQNQYEHIQENLRIKKERKLKNLEELNNQLSVLIIKHGNDRNVDEYLNKKMQPKLTQIYEILTK